MTNSNAPTVAEAAELSASECVATVDQATNLQALRALYHKEGRKARPRKTVLRAIRGRIDYLENWINIPLEVGI